MFRAKSSTFTALSKTFLDLCVRSVPREKNKKKTPEMIKKELVGSIVELLDGEENYLELNEEVRIAKEPKDGICLVKKYEYILKVAYY